MENTDEQTDIALRTEHLQKENPKSIYNFLAPTLREALDRVPVKYLTMDEEDLIELIQNKKRTFPREVALLRTRLWDLHSRAITDKNLSRIPAAEITAGICSPSYLRYAIMRNPVVTAYLIRPPVEYLEAANEALMYGVYKLRQVLDFPLWTAKGTPNVNVGKLMLEVVKLLDARVQGAPTQRHEIHQKTMQINASMKEIKKIGEETSMEALEDQLKHLRKEQEKYVLIPEKEIPLQQFKDEGRKAKAIEVEKTTISVRKKERDF